MHANPPFVTLCPQRNYRFFLLFIYTSTLLCLYAFGNSLAQLFVRHQQLVNEAKNKGLSGNNK